MCSEIFRLKFNAAFLIYSDIEVPRRYDDERNNILLELIQYDNTEKRAFLLGSVQVHLYEVIQVCINDFFHLGIMLPVGCPVCCCDLLYLTDFFVYHLPSNSCA